MSLGKEIAILVLSAIIIYACGKEDKNREKCAIYGEDCHQGESTLSPSPGPEGRPGTNGKNGLTALFNTVTASVIQCPGGGVVFSQGLDSNKDGILNSDEIKQSTVVCSGTDGIDGTDGINGINGSSAQFTPSIAITPCGPSSAPYKEALLGLTGGGVYSEVITQSGNANTIRNSLIPDGGYWDTDDSACNFTITTDGSGNRNVNWDGSSHIGAGPYNPGSAHYNATTRIWTSTY